MKTLTLLFASLALGATTRVPSDGDLVAVRCGILETGTGERIEDAVILIRDGVIEDVGRHLEVPGTARVIDASDSWVTPGFVHARSRAGVDGSYSGTHPEIRISEEFYPHQRVYTDALEAGITSLVLYPTGKGAPGRSAWVKPVGDVADEMIRSDAVYLAMSVSSGSSGRKAFRDALDKGRKHLEKVKKAREKHAEALKKWEDEQKKKIKEEKDKDKKKELEKEEFKAFDEPKADESTQLAIDLVQGRLHAVVDFGRPAGLLHMDDVLEAFTEQFKETTGAELSFDFALVARSDAWRVAEQLVERGTPVLLPTDMATYPDTRHWVNGIQRLLDAGVEVALVPDGDNKLSYGHWRFELARMIGLGLDRDKAMAAITGVAARVAGLGERVGSVAEGRDGDLLIFSGDPFATDTVLETVVVDGEIAFEEETDE